MEIRHRIAEIRNEVKKKRKDAKKEKTPNITAMSGYHARQNCDSNEQRANSFNGGAKYFASDRAKALSEVDNAKGYGIEWEMTSRLTSDGNILATILNSEFSAHLPQNFFKFENDATVDIECVSQIGTKAFYRNHYADFKAIYKYLNVIKTGPNYGNASCGMHVNISIANFGKDRATQRTNIMKLHNWINASDASYSFACKMLHRDEGRTRWCGKMRPNELDGCGSHGYCMNYAHLNEGKASRVEIRLVGAQKTYGNFRNTMETIFWLVKQSKELSADGWKDPIKLWSGCNQYVFDRLKDSFTDSAKLEIIRQSVKREELI